ncbi:hypothetical protein [Streptomyces umbrinus]|uniref:hypothetical protein n=1 Tax=Streptomyces umbrinus TaxID=67370 RepID=UPI00341E106A
MTVTALTDELRAAAARLRDNRNQSGYRVDCDSRELLDTIRILLRLREPLAQWLDQQAQYVADSGMYDVLAVDVACAVNNTGEPGRGQDCHIADRLSGRSLYEQLRRAAGEPS